MKKSLLTLGIASLIGVSSFTINASASDSEIITGLETTFKCEQENKNNANCVRQNKGDLCSKLTEEQKLLIEKGYSELTQVEKDIFDKYYHQPKNDLSKEEKNNYHEIQNKVYKYMDEDFKNERIKRREEKKLIRQENRGTGYGRGNGSCKK